ncbi:hypothetical protein JCM5353_008003 [Sporobolomyces roseus]
MAPTPEELQAEIDQLKKDAADKTAEIAQQAAAAAEAARNAKETSKELPRIPAASVGGASATAASIPVTLFEGAQDLTPDLKHLLTWKHIVAPLSLFTPEAQYHALKHSRELLPASPNEKQVTAAKEKLAIHYEADHLLPYQSFIVGFLLMLRAVTKLIVPKTDEARVWTDGNQFLLEIQLRCQSEGTWAVWREYGLLKIKIWRAAISNRTPWNDNLLAGFNENLYNTALATFQLQGSSINASYISSLTGTGQSFIGSLTEMAALGTTAAKVKIEQGVQQMHVIAKKEIRGEQPPGEYPSSIGYNKHSHQESPVTRPSLGPRTFSSPLPYHPSNPNYASNIANRALASSSSVSHPPPSYQSQPRASPYPPQSSAFQQSSTPQSFRAPPTSSSSSSSSSTLRCVACRSQGHSFQNCPNCKLQIVNGNLQAIEPDRGRYSICRNYNYNNCTNKNCNHAHACSVCGKVGHRFDDGTCK